MGDQCCSGEAYDFCAVGRAVTQPDWPGWTTPCYRPGQMHLRRYVNGAADCYAICPQHMDELDRRGQLASSDGGERG